MLVPKWADWEYFRELEERGLTMYGQMTAGSWIYIGTQGILQGTYETFAAAARTMSVDTSIKLPRLSQSCQAKLKARSRPERGNV